MNLAFLRIPDERNAEVFEDAFVVRVVEVEVMRAVEVHPDDTPIRQSDTPCLLCLPGRDAAIHVPYKHTCLLSGLQNRKELLQNRNKSVSGTTIENLQLVVAVPALRLPVTRLARLPDDLEGLIA